MDQSRLGYLFRQYANNNHTENERQEFIDLLTKDENADEIKNLVQKEIETSAIDKTISAERADKLYNKILSARPADAPVRKLFTFSRIAAAAVIVLMISVGGYIYFNNKTEKQIAKTNTQHKNDIAPGGNKAVLTLADGTQIVLDSANNGTITQQGNTKIIKLKNGELSYSPSGNGGEVLYNTISTPKGGQYQIVLADGSKVWLNAASSLKFPASFAGKERNVELTGEGYFEVAQSNSPGGQGKRSFIVTILTSSEGVGGGQVEVLGTHFNVNACEDEASIKTTLLEGSVRVTAGKQSTVIKPRQQAVLNKNGQISTNKNVDVDEVVAWKNGFFSFNNSDLQTVMRQIARWYDVEITYEGKISQREFGGKIDRNSNVSQVLKILEESKVHFRIEGKRIVVMP